MYKRQGDGKEAGEKAALQLGIDKVYTRLLPADKVRIVEELMENKSDKGKLVFVGDGINDAPVLAREMCIRDRASACVDP